VNICRKIDLEDADKSVIDNLKHCTEMLFVYCLVWSFGANTDEIGKLKFNNIIRELVFQVNLELERQNNI